MRPARRLSGMLEGFLGLSLEIGFWDAVIVLES